MPPIDWVHVVAFAGGVLLPMLQQWIARRRQPQPVQSPESAEPQQPKRLTIGHGELLGLLLSALSAPTPVSVNSQPKNAVDPAALDQLLKVLASPKS